MVCHFKRESLKEAFASLFCFLDNGLPLVSFISLLHETRERRHFFGIKRNVTINDKFYESQNVQKSQSFLKLIPQCKILTLCTDNELKSDTNGCKYLCMLLFWTSSHRIFLNLKQYYLIHLSCVANMQEYIDIYISLKNYSVVMTLLFKNA